MLDVILTNYKRVENIPLQIQCLRAQTIPVRIVLIDNNAEGFSPVDEASRIAADVYLHVSINPLMGGIRPIFAAGLCYGEFVLIMDDDLLIPKDYCERCLKNVKPGIGIIGSEGRDFIKQQDSWTLFDFGEVDDERICDLVERCYFCRTSIFSKLSEATKLLSSRFGLACYREDDLILSFCCRLAGLKSMVMPSYEDKAFVELPAPHALWQQPGHTENRSKIVEYIKNLYE